MSFTHTLTVAIQRSSGAPVSKTVSKTGGQELNISETIAAAASNALLAFALDVSQLKSCYIVASGAMTIETNDSGTPDATITLTADEPVVYYAGQGQDNPFGATDVDALYVTSTPGGLLEIYCLVDPTV